MGSHEGMRPCSLVAALLVALASTPAAAAVVWTGDLETGDLSQFDYVLNGDVGGNAYATVVQDLVLQGAWAARLELHDDAVWPGNMLRRVELQHLPEAARTAEGATTCFAWSLYLPETLPEDPGHSLGYWESQNSYQQMMAFNSSGEDLRFITQQPSYAEHWVAQGVLTPAQWHRIAMCVLWSKDPAVGRVDVWFDGESVVTGAGAKTLADDNPHFAQIGLLRANVDIGSVPVVYIDDVVEGDAIEDVDPPEPPGGDSSGGEGSTGGPGGVDTGDSEGGGSASTGASDTRGAASEGTAAATGDGSEASTGTAAADGDGGDGSGCGCRTRPAGPSAWWLVALVGAWGRGRARARRPGARAQAPRR